MNNPYSTYSWTEITKEYEKLNKELAKTEVGTIAYDLINNCRNDLIDAMDALMAQRSELEIEPCSCGCEEPDQF